MRSSSSIAERTAAGITESALLGEAGRCVPDCEQGSDILFRLGEIQPKMASTVPGCVPDVRPANT